MPTDNHAVPPPRRRPLGRGGAQGATDAAPTTAPVPPPSPPAGDPDAPRPAAPAAPPEPPEPTADRPAGRRGSGDPDETWPSPVTSTIAPPAPWSDGDSDGGPAPGPAADGPAGRRESDDRGQTRLVPGAAVVGSAERESASSPDGEPAPTPAERAAAPAASGGAASAGPDGADGQPRAPEEAGAASDSASAEDASGGAEEDDGRFTVVLDNFEGPFDLLLQLISKHKMDVTEVALSRVTDEFMAHIRAMGPDWDLDQTTEFLVVAATLLDLKAARLLPAAEVEDEADLALLEARDLLFARLLQYRAYKQVADVFADRLTSESHRHPRTVGLEPHHAELLPEVILSIGPEGFAKLAVKAMQAKPKPQVYVDHIHAPLVSVREQAEIVVARLRGLGAADFAALTEDAADTLTVVARFLALLELYRERAVALDQEDPLGTLTVRWCGDDAGGADPVVTDEFDQESAPAQPEEGASR